MDNKNILVLREQYEVLLDSLEKYGDYSNNPQKSNIRIILEILQNWENDGDLKELREYNEALYPPRGGLSEFFIWDNDFDKREALNEPIDNAKKIIRDMLRE